MTIYWEPDSEPDPDSIDVWHVDESGTTNGPLTVDTSGETGMPDTFGGIAPDAVRNRIAEWLKTVDWTDPLTKKVVLDLLTLDYERGTPP